jgi:SAM-dependent MidA family methyltransferase
MNPLARLLADRLQGGGSMPFSSFMAAALYHPDHGYYASLASRTGRHGDFFTSVSVGPVFGQLMAREFCAAWERMGKPLPFTTIEAGANDGQFALDVLTWVRDHRPDFFAALSWQIDEPLAAATLRQQATLAAFADQITHDAVDPAAHGCYFANELLDAIPCRRVRFSGGQWRELHVALDFSGKFCWQEKAPEDVSLLRRLAWLGTDFPEGYTTEIAPAVASQLRIAAERLHQGYLYFADYGYPARDYYAPHRNTGTLRCYRNHRAHEDPFDAIGETDLTCHVDFSFAATAAQQAGCEVLGFLDQSRFLTAAAAPLLRDMEQAPPSSGTAWQRQFQTLTHPAHLGQKFHFLVLGKNVSGLEPPAALAFSRPAAVAELLDPVFRLNED